MEPGSRAVGKIIHASRKENEIQGPAWERLRDHIVFLLKGNYALYKSVDPGSYGSADLNISSSCFPHLATRHLGISKKGGSKIDTNL